MEHQSSHPMPGPDEQGHYSYVGDQEKLPWAVQQAGHPIRSQIDLQTLAPILRQDEEWSFTKPQTYVVTIEGVFLLGGHLNEHVAVASGQPVLAAGEATLEEQADGTWHITELNNRSYGYMPDASSWTAVDQALAQTGIVYPDGFADIYPLEGTWAEVLEVLCA
jgi:hypothetical protein